jgi:epoxyqueuosine reductase
MNITGRITSRALELGFDLVGIAPAGMAPHAQAYADWIASGFAGEMAYMTRDPDRRSDLRRVLPDAKSVIVVGLSYYTIDLPDEVKNDPSRGLIARYAWGVDYHDVMTPRLEELAQFVREESRSIGISVPVETKVYVDTGPVLERDWAMASGLGFIGKNTCLIHPRMGSWLFLGVIIMDVSLGLDPSPSNPSIVTSVSVIPSEARNLLADGVHYQSGAEIPRRAAPRNDASSIGCGTCTRCLTACPTNAFPRPYILDARKCISYLTIELKGSIPIELRPLIGNRIFGCDICQEVCPWPMRFATPTKERAFFPVEVDRAAPKLIDLAQLSEEDFQQRFAGTPLLRSKRRGLLRNVAVALGNWKSLEAREALQRLADDPDPLIAEHARWGLAR